MTGIYIVHSTGLQTIILTAYALFKVLDNPSKFICQIYIIIIPLPMEYTVIPVDRDSAH